MTRRPLTACRLAVASSEFSVLFSLRRLTMKVSLMTRKSWIDSDTSESLIDDYARKLETFVQAFSDGVISESEISDQEARLVELMKEVEPHLDDAVHAKVTRMLCELTAYDIMQFVYQMQQSRAAMFRG
jgi:hypothetical protein